MSTHRFTRTATFRFALLYACVFSLSTLFLFAFLYWRIGAYGTEQMRTAIDAEIAVLLDDERRGRPLAQLIQERADTAESRSNYYLLQDARGQFLAGNIAPLAPASGLIETRVRLLQGGLVKSALQSALMRGVILPEDRFVAIGRPLADLSDLNAVVLRALIGSIVVTAILALAGGLVLGAGVLRRIEAIADTSATIIEGDLNRRVPLDGSGDEMDRLAQSLNTMLDRIQQLMEGMRQVSNDIAHDLRTPISRLRHRLERLAGRASTDAATGAEIQAALDEVDAILGTFSALLRIAQIESGVRRSGFRPVDLSAIFETLGEVYAPVAEDRRMRLVARVAAGRRAVGDRELLTQMVANLIENAIRHTPPGSAIQLELGEDGTGRLTGLVADDGPGIPEAERKNVFRRFYRLDRNRTSAGNGLGLSLVGAVAELHGIDLRLEDNRPGLRVEMRF